MATTISHDVCALPDGFADRLVLFGAGGLGRKIADTLRTEGHQVLAFCDNNPALWGSQIEGIPVVSPPSAANSFPSAVFMVAIWHPNRTEGVRHHVRQLLELGCRDVTCFVPMFWKYPKVFLPNMFWAVPGELDHDKPLIDDAAGLFDPAGRQEFERQVRLRLYGDVMCLRDPEPGPQYFPQGVVTLSPDETFVDCGAFDGDTVHDFIHVAQGRFRRIITFEPNPDNFRKLAASLTDDRVLVHAKAVGAKPQTLHLVGSGAGSTISQSGGTAIDCTTLDIALAGEQPTYIKMDIEGSEMDALLGAAETIRRHRPKLAICVYHRPDHLWRIPLLLKKLFPDSHMTLRSHMMDGFDTVCYCIPKP